MKALTDYIAKLKSEPCVLVARSRIVYELEALLEQTDKHSDVSSVGKVVEAVKAGRQGMNIKDI